MLQHDATLRNKEWSEKWSVADLGKVWGTDLDDVALNRDALASIEYLKSFTWTYLMRLSLLFEVIMSSSIIIIRPWGQTPLGLTFDLPSAISFKHFTTTCLHLPQSTYY